MASPAQIEANRLNALKSTGPRTEQGKAVSRFNALKSGLDAHSLVVPGEDPAELASLAANYQLEYQPASPTEQFLADSIVYADWVLRRLRKIEVHFFEMMAAGVSVNDSMRLLLRRIASEERSYFRSLKELQRRIAARAETAEAAAADETHESLPAEIGFVFPLPDSPPSPAPQLHPVAAAKPPNARPAPPLGNPALRL